MTQTTIPGGHPVPATFVNAQMLTVTGQAQQTAVQAVIQVGTPVRAVGQQIYAALSPIDLIPPFLGVPTIPSPDARLARVMRGH